MELWNSNGLTVYADFKGASSGMVTGSGTLLTITLGDTVKRILVDYGLFQESDKEFESILNEAKINELERNKIDFVLLTHAHLDHCGALPMLYRSLTKSKPYSGKIYGSKETLKQASYILLDAAKMNMKRANSKIDELNKLEQEIKHECSKFNRDEIPYDRKKALEELESMLEEEENKILYLNEDVQMTIKNFIPMPMYEEIQLCPGICVKFIPNTHINGATMIEIYVSYGEEHYGIAFSGDVGKEDTPLYKKMEYDVENNINTLVLESLHGAQPPKETYHDSVKTMKNIIKRAIREGKNVYIPVFALDRSAMLLKFMNDFRSKMNFNLIFDTVLGTQEFEMYLESYLTKKSDWFDYTKPFPFNTEKVVFIKNYRDHISSAKSVGPNVVLTASCMGYGGRVIDYFKYHIEDENAIFIFPGYLPPNCPSRVLLEAPANQIIEHELIYNIDNRRMKKRCEAYNLEGFSSHGYLSDKVKLIKRYQAVSKIILNHGDYDSINELKDALSEYTDAEIVVATRE